jgi:CheY-like chemotaxis protein
MAQILVIDDEKLQLVLRAALLEGAGHEVVALQNGDEAVAAFKEKPFDLVITDWIMPEITGLDIARHLKSINSSVPIILLTGLNMLLEDNDPRRRDLDLILPKPCDAEVLIKAIESLLYKPDPNNAVTTFRKARTDSNFLSR